MIDIQTVIFILFLYFVCIFRILCHICVMKIDTKRINDKKN
ncbi:hypothetical protein EZS27_007531 [termite gut metagenome]|uniref:Uncharacterized protein n=1 Tax=termite gut metagenome TaxID=433724 RepID=A0A5J4SHR8_9ZZZZ